ncbi:MAG: CvpA family protein [Pseudomonadales bacterium]|nr:CvpA family protein [Pseudomonadales bacterium]
MASVSVVDWVVLAVIVISTLVSIKRGFVKEALSLVNLVAAMAISRFFGPQVSTLLIDLIETATLRNTVAYIGIFFATLIMGGLINNLVVRVVRFAGLSTFDRLLGMIFGFGRGLLVVVVIVMVLARIGLAEDPLWQASLLLPRFVELADWVQMTGWESAQQML